MQHSLIARFMGPTWGPSGTDRTQVGPMLAPGTLLSGLRHYFKMQGKKLLISNLIKSLLVLSSRINYSNHQTTCSFPTMGNHKNRQKVDENGFKKCFLQIPTQPPPQAAPNNCLPAPQAWNVSFRSTPVTVTKTAWMEATRLDAEGHRKKTKVKRRQRRSRTKMATTGVLLIRSNVTIRSVSW